jgi:hypothetical protein
MFQKLNFVIITASLFLITACGGNKAVNNSFTVEVSKE